jgi:hypothetical protein
MSRLNKLILLLGALQNRAFPAAFDTMELGLVCKPDRNFAMPMCRDLAAGRCDGDSLLFYLFLEDPLVFVD